MADMNYASKLARFLLRETGSVLGSWEGEMDEPTQRALFGEYLGPCIKIDGDDELILGDGEHLTWREAELKK
jgi:hypothetical protein